MSGDMVKLFAKTPKSMFFAFSALFGPSVLKKIDARILVFAPYAGVNGFVLKPQYPIITSENNQ